MNFLLCMSYADVFESPQMCASVSGSMNDCGTSLMKWSMAMVFIYFTFFSCYYITQVMCGYNIVVESL